MNVAAEALLVLFCGYSSAFQFLICVGRFLFISTNNHLGILEYRVKNIIIALQPKLYLALLFQSPKNA
jgi:hypothetical protein